MKITIPTLVLFSMMTTQAMAVSKEDMLKAEVEMNVIDPCYTALLWPSLHKAGKFLNYDSVESVIKLMKRENKDVTGTMIDLTLEEISKGTEGFRNYKERRATYAFMTEKCIEGGSE